MHKLLQQPDRNPEQTVLGLLRHGRTMWNEEGRIQGTHDSPLSPTGREEVHDWGLFLSRHTIDHILASDLGRVRETVTIIREYNNAPVSWNPALREQDWGQWEGRTLTALQNEETEELEHQVRAGWDFRPPGGESRKEVLERALPVIGEAIHNFSGKNVLIVSHEGIVKSVIYHLAGRAFLPEEKKLLQKRQLHMLYGTEKKLVLGPLNVLPATVKGKR